MLTQNIVDLGGTYARCFALARCLAARGHSVTLLAAGAVRRLWPRQRLVAGVCLVEMGGLLPRRFRHGGLCPLDLLSRLLYSLPREYDIVQTFDHRPTVMLPALGHRAWRHTPVVADWCDLWGEAGLGGQRRGLERLILTPFDQAAERWHIQQADAVTPISHDLMQRAQALQARELRLVPVGANADIVQPLSASEARQKLSIPLDAPVLVYSGHTRFGEHLMTGAFIEVARRFPTVRLLLAGGPLPELESAVARAGLQRQVTHFGVLDYPHLGQLLACGDVMLLPYPDQGVDRAGFPNKLGDYMAAGRPVVSNPVGDLDPLIESESIGLLAAETPAEFAQAICTLLADPELRGQLGQRARHLAETTFAWQVRAQTLESLYQDLLSGRDARTT